MRKANSISPRIIKYAKARQNGLTKKASKAIAGYSPTISTTSIEGTDAHKTLSIKEAILSHITVEELTAKHVENIVQDTDKNARNNAIKLAYDRIEPDSIPLQQAEKITIVMKES